MANPKTSMQRRSFLKATALVGGGLMINFSWLPSFGQIGNNNKPELPEDWIELNGYIKITPDNVIKIINPNPEFRAKCNDLIPDDCCRRTGC